MKILGRKKILYIYTYLLCFLQTLAKDNQQTYQIKSHRFCMCVKHYQFLYFFSNIVILPFKRLASNTDSSLSPTYIHICILLKRYCSRTIGLKLFFLFIFFFYRKSKMYTDEEPRYCFPTLRKRLKCI